MTTLMKAASQAQAAAGTVDSRTVSGRTRMLAMAGITATLAVAAMGFSSGAEARDNVSISVGIGVPGVQVGVSNAYPVYSPPRPVYVRPRPVYVQPPPVYYAPRPVYYAPAPVYYAPQPVYYGPPGHRRGHRGGYYAQPPGYGHGHGHGYGHRR